MGEKLHSLIKVLEQRMDTGVLHDLSVTRLHMLIGDQLVKQSLELPDEDSYINLIEKAMQSYFQKEFFETEGSEQQESPEEATAEPEIPEMSTQNISPGQTAVQTPINFKLNIKKNEDNCQTLINDTAFIFSPTPVRNILTTTVLNAVANDIVDENYDENSMEAVYKYLEETAFVKTIRLLTDIFQHLKEKFSVEQKIRLGLVIYRLFGYGDFKLEIKPASWNITLAYADSTLPDIDYFSLGFVRGIFVAADIELYNKLNFVIANTSENSIITGLYI
jgi:hypothetical protein